MFEICRHLQCVSTSWFLSVDYQLWLVAYYPLYLLYKRPISGVAACIGLVVVGQMSSIFITWFYDYPAVITGSLLQYAQFSTTRWADEPFSAISILTPFWTVNISRQWCYTQINGYFRTLLAFSVVTYVLHVLNRTLISKKCNGFDPRWSRWQPLDGPSIYFQPFGQLCSIMKILELSNWFTLVWSMFHLQRWWSIYFLSHTLRIQIVVISWLFGNFRAFWNVQKLYSSWVDFHFRFF